jgi:hypothetical protein
LQGVLYFLDLLKVPDYGGWSAYRETSFGAASMHFANATHVYYQWNRGACNNITNYEIKNSQTGATSYSPQTVFQAPFG